MLTRDKDVYDLYKLLKSGSKDIKTILKEFNGTLSAVQLVDLIDLINQAKKTELVCLI